MKVPGNHAAQRIVSRYGQGAIPANSTHLGGHGHVEDTLREHPGLDSPRLVHVESQSQHNLKLRITRLFVTLGCKDYGFTSILQKTLPINSTKLTG